MSYDAIVVGAGPAGSVTAKTVAAAGFSVLVLEKNTTCRSPCAGYISRTINLELPENCIIQSKITTMRTYFPDLSFHDFQLDGFVVDRPSFDTALVMKAKESGAEFKWDSPLSNLIPGGVEFRGGKASGKVIVGADGVFSKTATLLGMERQKVAVCAQYHVKGIRLLSETGEIFFDNNYAPGGYVWVYPTGEDSAKIGLGLTKGNPREYLDAFIGDRIADRFAGRKKEYITGALPVAGLREKLVFNNVLLAGDSAGMADPITGAGINNAVLSGEIAGRTIIEALENDDVAVLLNYETRIRRLLGKPLARALEKRKRLDACVNNELLQEHLPEFWVTFKQYWA
ncbi:MAG: NAD(P)/FAD-dependent oxidoreductase [Candidatus Methanoperedens sp.]|nr:NAD(P)/FAD-dependent oxidoreductase [Candidatus Methanoperedens sp.]MCZ7396799.1 NAD(P)/FAD-dependent oxidoreductase [Candidatus Methanoperedens sp.]